MKRSGMTHPAFIVALTLLGAGALGFGAAISRYRLHLTKLEIQPPGNRQLSQIPSETDRWLQISADRVEAAEVLEVLGTRNYISRVYELKRGEGDESGSPFRIELHAAYYTGMIDTVPHVPERCFVGGGLQQATSSRVVELPLDTTRWMADPTVPENLRGESGTLYTAQTQYNYSDAPGSRFRLPRDVTPERRIPMRVSSFGDPGSEQLFAGYFFIANGGVVANANEVRTLAFDLTSDYAYYMKVQLTSTRAASPEDLADKAASLLDGLLPELMRCVPDWVEVETGQYPADNPRRPGGAGDPGGGQG